MKQNSSQKRKTKGFTLVELIVVIAILAILAGVGAVAYTGYIEYTKKGLDKQTVGEIIHALELADYADPGLFGENPSGSALITTTGVKGSNAAVSKALEDAGINATLTYDWENAPDVSSIKGNLYNSITDNLSYLGSIGTDGKTVEVGYADIADDCWDAVRSAAEFIVSNKENGLPKDYEASIVLYAAQKSATSDGQLNWSDFTMEWGSVNDLSVLLPVVVARNYSFAAYLEKNGNYEGVKDDIVFLRDFAQVEKNKGSKDYLTTTDWSKNGTELSKLAQEYMETDVYSGKSQAQIDSEGYYTFMSSMYNQYKGQTETDEKGYPVYKGSQDTFWEEAGGYISTAAQLVKMTQEERQSFINSLPDTGKAIQIRVLGREADGRLKIKVDPIDAKPTDSSSGTNEGSTFIPKGITRTVTLDCSSGTAVFHTEPDDGILAVTSGGGSKAFGLNKNTLPPGITVTKVVINSTEIKSGDTTPTVELGNGTARVTGWPQGGVAIKFNGGTEAGKQSDVSITFHFSDNSSQTISFTFWVI